MCEYVTLWVDDLPDLKRGEEIVRCRDCEHFTLEGSYRFEDGSTNVDFCEYVRGWLLQVTPDGFCAWGERRTSE